MVQPNQRVYSARYLTPSSYTPWIPHIAELEKKMKTEIKYNFEDQCFEIKGRSQNACDNTMIRIVIKLLPQLYSEIDKKMMKGTYEDLEIISAMPSPIQSRVSSASSSAVGRPPTLDESKEEKVKKEGTEAYYYNETESDDSDEDEDEFIETFTFAKNVRNPMDILSVPSVGGSKPIDYLSVIGNDTDTECSLINKKVNIVGTNESSVKEALQRFKNLQTIYKRSKRPTSVVSCIHMPSETEFAIYFCSLDRFAHKVYVDLLKAGGPYWVLLSVLKDDKGSYQKPKDLLDVPVPPTSTRISWMQAQERHSPQQQLEMSLEERMKRANFKTDFGNTQYGMAPDQQPLWGENKNYVHVPSMQTTPPRKPATSAATPPPKSPQDNFPALPSTPRKAPPAKGPQRRVVRVLPQKSGRATPKSESHAEMLRQYNLHCMRTNLAEGLESVRGFKGGIKLSASLGKILWTNIKPETQKKIWMYQQVNDILMKEQGIRPVFNGLATKDNDVIAKISEMLPPYHGISAYFEIHANARNQPILPYKPVVLYMSQQAVDFKKIVVATNKITEVNWVSLDRKFDFQMNLQTEELTRMDVKPYSTFLKKISIHPHTRQMTYEDVPDFLQVSEIYLKNTTKIRLHFPFVVEITRVEKLPLIPQTSLGFNINKILADTGRGEVWYTVELFYSVHDEVFKTNADLPAGKFASWTVDDVLGADGDDNGPLVQFVRCLLLLTERSENVI
ncbi:hypothetical protein G6F60_005894 [Rhizopus arrhizus]|nr:hypothetical protein G6F32_002404 [Rhizopus arrhizus]KAG1384214.1 hypothetical protein G6F61_000662 [Rhizopus arrhizus]KAG1402170.1 hypothetical protein G6F60_005894 [Rhizopus arrhizus]